MSYEYKEEILLDIGSEPNCNYESESNRYYDKIDELDHVYAQAEKADEYEAKAIAFDFIREARKEVLKDVRERGVKLPADLDKFSMMTERIINKYESSESDE